MTFSTTDDISVVGQDRRDYQVFDLTDFPFLRRGGRLTSSNRDGFADRIVLAPSGRQRTRQ